LKIVSRRYAPPSPVGTRGVSRRYAPPSPVGTQGVSRRYAPQSPVGTHPVLQEGGQHAGRIPLDARTMTAAHAEICRDAGMRARTCADGRRGQVWCSRRLTRGGGHHRHAREHCLREDGHVMGGWSTDWGARVQHAYGWERWRRATPARHRLRRVTATRSSRQRHCGPRATGPHRVGGEYAGKALQKDGKYDSIHAPIVWQTHVCPQIWTGRHAHSPAKENRARARPPYAR
jgi:hypothetical protein